MRSCAVLLTLPVLILSACAMSLANLTDEQLQQQADSGNGAAQYALAQRLADRKDYPQAMQRMQQVAQSHGAGTAERASAARQAGDWYQQGLGETRNHHLALQWWKKAAALGNPDASERLAEHCRRQHNGELVADCMDDFTRAARHGSLRAQKALAQWYQQQHQDKTAVQWLEKAADQGDAQSQYRLAQHYRRGTGTDTLPAKANLLYHRAAQQGYPAAIRWLAAHSTGAQALHWYQQAAQAGDVPAQLWLALAFLHGSAGLRQNTDTAIHWLQQAFNGGSAQAGYEYSQLQTDENQRQYYLEQAAKRGWRPAQHQLAQQYTDAEDYVRARKLWQQLAKGADPQAQRILGDFQRQGLGGRADPKAAVKNYRRAALAGDQAAQYQLGLMYQQGLGTARNRIHAYAWYALAATSADPDSVRALNALERSLSAQEISDGQKLALHQQQRITNTQHHRSAQHESNSSATDSHIHNDDTHNDDIHNDDTHNDDPQEGP